MPKNRVFHGKLGLKNLANFQQVPITKNRPKPFRKAIF